MKKLMFCVVLICFVFTGFPLRSAWAQASNMTKDEALATLKKGPQNWYAWCNVVEGGGAELLGDQKIKVELLNLLERISVARDKALRDPLFELGKSKERWTGDCEDECSECLTSLKKQVASLGDKRALKLFVDLGSSYSLDFGEDAYPYIVSRYHTAHWLGRSEMLRLLTEMVKRGIGTEDTRKQAKSLVYDAATKDEDVSVRTIAMEKFKYFGQEEGIRKLKEVIANDSYFYINQKTKKKIYPVRESAKMEIERLSKLGVKDKSETDIQASTEAVQNN